LLVSSRKAGILHIDAFAIDVTAEITLDEAAAECAVQLGVVFDAGAYCTI